jgi:hypothetical protein
MTNYYGGRNATSINAIDIDQNTAPTSNQILKYNSTTNTIEWGADTTSTNATELQGESISSTTPTDEQHLVYDSGTSEWTPTTSAGGGGKVVQVVTDTNTNYYDVPDSTWRGTGYYLAITPTSATNKIIGICAIPCKGYGPYVIGNLDWYQLDSGLSAGDTLTGGTRLYEATDSGGKFVDWRTGAGSDNQPFINMDFADENYDTTSEIFYNVVAKRGTDSWDTNPIPFTLILMEIDES